MTSTIVAFIWLSLATLTFATKTTLYYYSADAKTANAVIGAIESKRFSYEEMGEKLQKLASSGKLKLIKKAILEQEEKSFNDEKAPLKIKGEQVPIGLYLKASSFEMREKISTTVNLEVYSKAHAKKFFTKYLVITPSLEAKTWQVIHQLKDKNKINFLVIQNTDELLPDSDVNVPEILKVKKSKDDKHATYSYTYHLVELSESTLKKYVGLMENADFNKKKQLTDALLKKAKVKELTQFANSINSITLFSNQLNWIKNGDTAQLGFQIRQQVKSAKEKEKDKHSIDTTITWSEHDKFIKEPQYTFKNQSTLEDNQILALRPSSKPQKKAKNLLLIISTKKL